MTTRVHKIAVLPGDGIGPEVVDATLMVLDAVQKTGLVHLEYLKGDAGFDSIKKFGTNLPEKTVEMMKRTSACLKGPMTTPEEPGTPRSAAVTMRSLFNLYANVRPARTLPNVTALKPGIDMIVVRENTEGLYSGKEFEVTPDAGVAMRIITRAASERIAKFALDLAMKRRKKLAYAHKGNILKITDGIFKRSVLDAAKMMLDYLGETKAANLVEKATNSVLKEGKILTYDLGGNASTSDVGKAIAEKVVSLK